VNKKTVVGSNIVYNLVGQGMLLVLGLLSVKFIYSDLGGDALGIIYFTILVNRVLNGLLSKGLCAPAVREVSSHHKSDFPYVVSFVRTGSIIAWSVFLFLSVISYTLAPYFIKYWLNIETLNHADATLVLRLLGVSVLLSFPVSFFLSLIQGLQKMRVTNAIDVSSAILEQGGILILLVIDTGLIGIVIWMFIARLLKAGIYLAAVSRFFTPISILPFLDPTVVNRNKRFSIDMIFVSFYVFINKQADKLIVSKLLSVTVLGYYGYVYELVSKILAFPVVVAQAAYPAFCEHVQENDKSALIRQYRLLQELVCFLVVPFFALTPFFCLPVLGFIFDEEVAQSLVLPVVLLSVGAYMNATLSLPHRVLLADGRPDIAVKQYKYACLVTIPAIYLLALRYGLPGASLSLIITYLVGYIYMVPRVYRRSLELNVVEFFKLILSILGLALATYGLSYGLLQVYGEINLLSLAMHYIGASTGYLVLTFYFMSGDIKKEINVRHLKKTIRNLLQGKQ